MKKAISVLILLLAWSLPGKTLVLPFRTPDGNSLSWQWLGQGVSYYLSRGLAANGLPVFSPEKTAFILQENRIPFPFAMSKATALHLAARYQAGQLLWGELVPEAQNPGRVVIKAFLIKLDNFSQQHLPLLKGRVDDLENVKFELLLCAGRQLPGNGTAMRPPDLEMSPHQYETLIKSLLVSDRQRRLELILPIASLSPDSTALNYEAARALYENGDFTEALVYLKNIGPGPDTTPAVLEAAILAQKDEPASALVILQELLNSGRAGGEALNNLALLKLGSGESDAAGELLDQALSLDFDPDIAYNRALVYFRSGQNQQAIDLIVEALRFSPGHQEMLELLDLLLKGGLPPGQGESGPTPLLKLPFQVRWLPEKNGETPLAEEEDQD